MDAGRSKTVPKPLGPALASENRGFRLRRSSPLDSDQGSYTAIILISTIILTQAGSEETLHSFFFRSRATVLVMGCASPKKGSATQAETAIVLFGTLKVWVCRVPPFLGGSLIVHALIRSSFSCPAIRFSWS